MMRLEARPLWILTSSVNCEIFSRFFLSKQLIIAVEMVSYLKFGYLCKILSFNDGEWVFLEIGALGIWKEVVISLIFLSFTFGLEHGSYYPEEGEKACRSLFQGHN